MPSSGQRISHFGPSIAMQRIKARTPLVLLLLRLLLQPLKAAEAAAEEDAAAADVAAMEQRAADLKERRRDHTRQATAACKALKDHREREASLQSRLAAALANARAEAGKVRAARALGANTESSLARHLRDWADDHAAA